MNDQPDRPAGLWVVAILAIVLGGLGSCGGTLGLASLAIQDSVAELQEDLQRSQPNQNEQMRELNREMQQASLDIARTWRIPSAIGNIVNVLGSFFLLIAAILLFRWHPQGPTLFIAAAIVSVVADLVVGGVGVVIQQQTVAAMEEITARMADAGGDPAAQRMVGGVMRASGTFGLCFAIGWLLAKLGFYVGSIVYLRKVTVRALFG